jgi:Methylase of polypeptide chain release factors
MPPRDGEIHVVDWCAGSGAMGLAIAHSSPHAHVLAVEVSPEASDYLRSNVARLAQESVEILIGDVTDALRGSWTRDSRPGGLQSRRIVLRESINSMPRHASQTRISPSLPISGALPSSTPSLRCRQHFWEMGEWCSSNTALTMPQRFGRCSAGPDLPEWRRWPICSVVPVLPALSAPVDKALHRLLQFASGLAGVEPMPGDANGFRAWNIFWEVVDKESLWRWNP